MFTALHQTTSDQEKPMSHEHRAKRTTDWVELGSVSTPIATLAIVAPCMADALDTAWLNFTSPKSRQPTVDTLATFDQWTLRQELWNARGEHHTYEERALLFNTLENGGFVVEGRFGPAYVSEGQAHHDDRHVVLVELRIRLADIDDCDEVDCDIDDCDDTGCGHNEDR